MDLPILDMHLYNTLTTSPGPFPVFFVFFFITLHAEILGMGLKTRLYNKARLTGAHTPHRDILKQIFFGKLIYPD